MNTNNILRRKRVEEKTGLSRSTLYAFINPKHPNYDATFPKPVSLGARAVGWIESEIDFWLKSRNRRDRSTSGGGA
jgi:prophage regulatory protein